MAPFTPPPRGGISWRLAGERLALLAWGRAILLQLAHPSIAAGVAAHSGFRDGPVAPFVRLHHTIRAMRRIAFGTPAQAAAAVDGIRRIHDRVHGTTAAGVPYSAHDPALLLWVHVTLIDSNVRILEPLLGGLDAEARDAYCRESAPLAIALGADPRAVPLTWAGIGAHLAAQVDSGAVRVGDQARALAPLVLRPPLGTLVWPLARTAERVSVGMLPPEIRTQYGVAWEGADDAALARTFRRLRAVRRRLPAVVARWPEAR